MNVCRWLFTALIFLCGCRGTVTHGGQSPGDSGFAGPRPFEDMQLVQAGTHSFYVDRFETSELAPGDFFAVRNQIPRVAVSLREARSICELRGKRLCTPMEWKNACLGTHRRKFSYANGFQDQVCNVSGSGLTMSGEFPRCRTESGVFDLVGNAMEWVDDETGGRNLAMGGSFRSGRESDCFTEFFFPAGAIHAQVGFRCCR